ncbi:armadillo repeat containing 2 [Pycnococcus provasolii]|uniref:Armadillo repeat containing 2 n=1 Tax=Pycnococcus provasolii TaxID=41880 RepID=A0A830H5A8_9CHLO|nr:armadillo repeat containing 2 [Pycnococcus provasolii]
MARHNMNMGNNVVDPLLDCNRSSVANVLKEARASLREPSRPFTPRDASRRLFNSSDFGTQRPPSAYGAPSTREFAQAAGLRGTLKPLPPLHATAKATPIGPLAPIAAPERPPSAGAQRSSRSSGDRPPSSRGRPPVAAKAHAPSPWDAATATLRAAPAPEAASQVLDVDAERRDSAAQAAAPAVLEARGSDDPRLSAWREKVRTAVAALNKAADAGDEGGMLAHTETMGVLVDQGTRAGAASWLGWLASMLYADANEQSPSPACDEDAHGTCREGMQRALFRVVEAPRAELLLRACRCVLSLAGTPREAIVALKAVYKVSKEERHDIPMRRERLLQPLLQLVCDALPSEVPIEGMQEPMPAEALVYAAGALKNSTASDEGNQKALLKLGAVPSLCEALVERATLELRRQQQQAQKSKSSSSSSSSSNDGRSGGVAQVAVQVAALLRNLADASGGLRSFQGAPAAEALSAMVAAYPSYAELTLNTCRVLSRLSTDTMCRLAMEQCATLGPCLVASLKAHPGNAPLVARAAYVLGNLTMDCTHDERRRLGTEHGGAGVVSALVHRYSSALGIKQSSDESKSSSSATTAAASALTPGSPAGDALIKLLRVLANLSMDSDVGERIAKSSIIASDLLGIVENHSGALCSRGGSGGGGGGRNLLEEELALNAAAAITNLSYWHATPENALLGKHAASAPPLLLPLLLSSHDEAVLEAVRALGNCFRRAEARTAGIACRCDEALVLLLDHAHREVAYHVCGALVNLATDGKHASQLARYGASSRLGDLLVRAALAEPRPDAELACVAGKALYNAVALCDASEGVGASAEELGDVCRCLEDAEQHALSSMADALGKGDKRKFVGDFDDDGGSDEELALSEFLSLSKRLRELLLRRGAVIVDHDDEEEEEEEEEEEYEELPAPPPAP